jgi:hypothetical protein
MRKARGQFLFQIKVADYTQSILSFGSGKEFGQFGWYSVRIEELRIVCEDSEKIIIFQLVRGL